MPGKEHRRYRFGPFEMDTSAKVLFAAGEPVKIAPRSVETLRVLVENAGAVLTKEELLSRIWPGRVVDEVNLSQHVSLLRKALGARADGTEYIRTFPARGYQFCGPVEQIDAPVSTQLLQTRDAAVSSLDVNPPLNLPSAPARRRPMALAAALGCVALLVTAGISVRHGRKALRESTLAVGITPES